MMKKSASTLPTELIFFVTSHCNLQCRHCFNWQNLQRGDDLTIDEIAGLAKSLPTLRSLMLSGGEPFLRKDLVDICRLFAEHCRLGMIDIPTSGTLVDRTLEAVTAILEIDPPIHLSVGISLDGLEAYHDKNRGVEGSFKKAIESCDRLLQLKKKSKRLKINILTTLTGDNKEELIALKEMVATRFPEADNLYWGVARGDVREGTASDILPEDLALIDRQYLDYDIHKKGPRRQGMNRRFYELRQEAFTEHRQPVPCVAASKIAVIYDDGSVAPCELLPPVGNLREAPFEKIWDSREMREARESIAGGNCSCTHECFLYPSFEAFLLERPLTLVRLAGASGLVQYISAKLGSGATAFRVKKFVRQIIDKY